VEIGNGIFQDDVVRGRTSAPLRMRLNASKFFPGGKIRCNQGPSPRLVTLCTYLAYLSLIDPLRPGYCRKGSHV
jgi:hypothetical protein